MKGLSRNNHNEALYLPQIKKHVDVLGVILAALDNPEINITFSYVYGHQYENFFIWGLHCWQ